MGVVALMPCIEAIIKRHNMSFKKSRYFIVIYSFHFFWFKYSTMPFAVQVVQSLLVRICLIRL